MGWACFAVMLDRLRRSSARSSAVRSKVAQQVARARSKPSTPERRPNTCTTLFLRAVRGLPMTSVAVVAHNGKTLGDGLGRLREVLAEHGVTDPLWFEVPKSRKVPGSCAPRRSTRAPSCIFVWGGDGSSSVRSTRWSGGDGTSPRATLAILPAGTANLLATNLGIPDRSRSGGAHRPPWRGSRARHRQDERRALRRHGRHGDRQPDDPRRRPRPQGSLRTSGIRVDRAHVPSAASRSRPRSASTGTSWFDGDASCVLVGNVGKILGGVNAFEHAKTDDGLLDLAVITAEGAVQWARTLARATFGHAEKSTARARHEGDEDHRHDQEGAPVRDGRRRHGEDEGAQDPRRAGGDHGPRPRPPDSRSAGLHAESLGPPITRRSRGPASAGTRRRRATARRRRGRRCGSRRSRHGSRRGGTGPAAVPTNATNCDLLKICA